MDHQALLQVVADIRAKGPNFMLDSRVRIQRSLAAVCSEEARLTLSYAREARAKGDEDLAQRYIARAQEERQQAQIERSALRVLEGTRT